MSDTRSSKYSLLPKSPPKDSSSRPRGSSLKDPSSRPKPAKHASFKDPVPSSLPGLKEMSYSNLSYKNASTQTQRPKRLSHKTPWPLTPSPKTPSSRSSGSGKMTPIEKLEAELQEALEEEYQAKTALLEYCKKFHALEINRGIPCHVQVAADREELARCAAVANEDEREQLSKWKVVKKKFRGLGAALMKKTNRASEADAV